VAVGVLVVVGVCVVVGVRVRVRETRASAQPATHTGRSEDMQDLPTTPHRLDHENLDVYRCAIKFLSFAFELVNSLPRGEGEQRDQLKQAAISVVLNIAEAAGKPTTADRARFHAIARGSAMQCGAQVDVCVIARRLEPARAEHGKGLLVRIVSMLTKMCR